MKLLKSGRAAYQIANRTFAFTNSQFTKKVAVVRKASI